MLAFSEHRRSSPSLNEIRSGMGASRSAVHSLEDRSEEAGIKMTDLRRILFHGILEAGPRATAVEIWKTLGRIMEQGHVPSQGSIQRNLNLFLERGGRCHTRCSPAGAAHGRTFHGDRSGLPETATRQKASVGRQDDRCWRLTVRQVQCAAVVPSVCTHKPFPAP